MIIIVFMISGACAGLAGVGEITGPIGQLHRNISPDYGFTAIIVAFLGKVKSSWNYICFTNCSSNLLRCRNSTDFFTSTQIYRSSFSRDDFILSSWI